MPENQEPPKKPRKKGVVKKKSVRKVTTRTRSRGSKKASMPQVVPEPPGRTADSAEVRREPAPHNSGSTPLTTVARVAGRTAGRVARIADKAVGAVRGVAKKIRRND